MTMKLALSILSLVLVIITPIVFYIYLRKVRKLRPGFWNVVIGIVSEFLCKDVLLKIAVALLASIEALSGLLSDHFTAGMITVVLSVLLLTGGLVGIKKIIYHDDLSAANASGLALGALLADILMNFLMAACSNLIYIVQMNNGTLYDNLLKSVSSSQAYFVIESYNNLPQSYFLYIGIITLASCCSNYLICMVLARKKENKALWLFTLMALITVVTGIFYTTNPLTASYANPSLMLFAGLFFGFADINCRLKLSDERRMNDHV